MLKKIRSVLSGREKTTELKPTVDNPPRAAATQRPSQVARKKTKTTVSSSKNRLGKVKNIIAVASGKGGVGKSTTTVNLAYSLAKSGAKVGILDADIYGPSIPMMVRKTKFEDQSQNATEGDSVIYPPSHAGVKIMSIGLFNDVDHASIMRGPMASSVIKQFMNQVDWGSLDYLLIDYPPGTGDIQLTLAQSSILTGAVIVTTSQEVSLIDVSKAIKMFEVTKTPILGLIENMSYFKCDQCEKKHPLFAEGGAIKLGQLKQIPLLGHIPFEPIIMQAADEGTPGILKEAKSESAKAYQALTDKLRDELDTLQASRNDGALKSFKIKWQGGSSKKNAQPTT